MRASRLVGVLFLVIVTVAIAYFAFTRRPGGSVSSNSTLYLRIHGPLREAEGASLLAPFSSDALTLRGLVGTLKRAARDSRIKAVVVTPDMGSSMWAQAQEVRTAILEVRNAGKPVVAFMESASTMDYYVASAANRVLLMPGGTLDLSGVATYELFFRGALDKLGVTPDLLHIGEFKTYSNTFTEKAMTAAHRDMNESLNREAFNELVRAIAEGRKKSEGDIRATIDDGPFLGDGAVAAGLVDALAYEDQIDDTAPVAGTSRLDGDDYGPSDDAGFRAPRIALLYAVGDIASGQSTFTTTGGTVIGSDTFVDWIRSARADTSVKAIVIRIDSPGGSASASEVIWRELMLTREVKPLIVSMGDVAASGGYYIAVPAHAIVAQPGTITGSIGVVTGKFSLKNALDKIGVTTGVISEGKMAEINSPFRAFTPAEHAKIESQMQATYEQFIARVAQSRGSTPQKIDAIAQGRVWTGRQARELGLVDALGGLDEAIVLAKARAHIDAATVVALDVYPKRRGLLDAITNPFGGASMTEKYGKLGQLATQLEAFSRYRAGETLMLMPGIYY